MTMKIISNHRLYEDFLDDLNQEDITSKVGVNETAFTNWLIVTITGISKKTRSSKEEFDKCIEKFDKMFLLMLDKMP